jgi:hypothetical protein
MMMFVFVFFLNFIFSDVYNESHRQSHRGIDSVSSLSSSSTSSAEKKIESSPAIIAPRVRPVQPENAANEEPAAQQSLPVT